MQYLYRNAKQHLNHVYSNRATACFNWKYFQNCRKYFSRATPIHQYSRLKLQKKRNLKCYVKFNYSFTSLSHHRYGHKLQHFLVRILIIYMHLLHTYSFGTFKRKFINFYNNLLQLYVV